MFAATARSSESGLVVTTAVDRAAAVVLVVRATVYVLAPLVYLAQDFHTPAGGAFIAALFVWGVWRLATRSSALPLILIDVAFVAVAALMEPLLVSPDIADPSMSVTRVIAYPTIVALAISEPLRRSFAAMSAVLVASCLGDILLFGSPHASVLFLVVDWAGAAWVRALVVRAATATDQAAAEFRHACVEEEVAAARIRFELEQLATLHDTAASTLLMAADPLVTDQSLVASQALRDVDVLTQSPIAGDSDRPTDLYELLKIESLASRIPVRLSEPIAVEMQFHTAWAVTSATREALTNVRRHAGATSVSISITPDSVTITDDGVGFDTSTEAAGFGLRQSIEGRMRSVGGRAEVTSGRAGTSVRLSWGPKEAEGTSAQRAVPAGRNILRNYQIGLAIGQAAVAVQLCGTGLVVAPDGALLPSLIMVAVLVAMSPLVVAFASGRLRSMRPVAVLALLVLVPTFVTVIPEELLITPANWVAVSGGWALAALLSGWVSTRNQVAAACGLVVAMWLIQGLSVVGRVPSGAAVTFVGYGITSMAVMQCSAICLAWVLAEAARDAEVLGGQRHELDAQVAVRAAIQEDYRQHFAKVNEGVVALLRGLGDGSSRLEDPAVRSRARLEYASLRRLFAQAGSFDHPLVRGLRSSLDAASERGVKVDFDIAASLPAFPGRALTPTVAAIISMLESAMESVRIVVSMTDRVITVSVLSDAADSEEIQRLLRENEFVIRRLGALVWLRVDMSSRSIRAIPDADIGVPELPEASRRN